jgi:hypothetical protein
MASRGKMLIEILNYSGVIGGDSFLASVQWAAGRRCSYSPWTLLQHAHFCLKKLALAFLTACVYLFLTSLKSSISRGLFVANAERHRMFLCWSRADGFRENSVFCKGHAYLRW